MSPKLTIAAVLAATLFTSTAALAAPGVVTGAVNMREGPGTGYDIITQLKKGKFVDIDECDAGWCEVDVNGHEGFVSASYLALVDADDEDDEDGDDDDDDHDVSVEVCLGGFGGGGYGYGYGEFCIED